MAASCDSETKQLPLDAAPQLFFMTRHTGLSEFAKRFFSAEKIPISFCNQGYTSFNDMLNSKMQISYPSYSTVPAMFYTSSGFSVWPFCLRICLLIEMHEKPAFAAQNRGLYILFINRCFLTGSKTKFKKNFHLPCNVLIHLEYSRCYSYHRSGFHFFTRDACSKPSAWFRKGDDNAADKQTVSEVAI